MREKINEKLLLYLSNKISKQGLYKWAIGVLHEILENVVSLEYLKMLPIVTELLEMEDMDDVQSDCLVQRIYNILSRDEKASYTFAMKIPDKFTVGNLLQLGNILEKYLKQRKLTQDEFEILKKESKKRISHINTMNELLEMQIMGLLNLGYDLENEDTDMKFALKSTVYISEDMEENLKDEFLNKIISLVDCYNGKRCVYVQVWFYIDTEDISIHL